MKRAKKKQRGAVSVEFVLAMPVLLVLVLGGLHLGRVLNVKHRLSDAVGYAARAAMVATQPGQPVNPGTVNATVLAHMAGTNMCTSITTQTIATGVVPYRQVQVTSTCNLIPPFGATFLGNMGLSNVSVTAAMPLN